MEIYPEWLELPLAGTSFNCPKPVRAIEGQWYLLHLKNILCKIITVFGIHSACLRLCFACDWQLRYSFSCSVDSIKFC